MIITIIITTCAALDTPNTTDSSRWHDSNKAEGEEEEGLRLPRW